MTWKEAKDQIARENGLQNWKDIVLTLHTRPYTTTLDYLDQASRLYAREVADKAWEAGWGRCEQMWINSLKDKYKITALKKEEFMKQLDI